MLKYLTAFLLTAFIGVQFAVWFGKNGVADWRSLRHDIADRKQEIEASRQRNDVLKVEIVDMQSGLEVIAERARNDFGLVAPGETFYRVVPPSKSIHPGFQPH